MTKQEADALQGRHVVNKKSGIDYTVTDVLDTQFMLDRWMFVDINLFWIYWELA